MGRSASGSPYAAPKAPNAPQGTNDYSYLSGIYGASYGRKKAAEDFTRPTLLARPVSPVENLITTIAEPPVTTPEPEVTTPEPEVPATEPTVDTTLTDLQTDDEAFEDYLESDDYVQTTVGSGSTTMEEALADPFNETVISIDDVPTMEEGVADTTDDTVMTMEEVPTMEEAVADTTDDTVMTMEEVPTMEEYLAEQADQDARDRVKLEELLQTNVLSGEGLLSIREYNNLIQDRIKALSESRAEVTVEQLREEQLEIERLQGLTEKNALEAAYQDYVEAYNVANTEYTLGENIFTLGDPADNPVDPTLQPSDEGLTRDRDEVTVISDPPKQTDTGLGTGSGREGIFRPDVAGEETPPTPLNTQTETEVVTTPEETESTVPDEPESVVLDPVEQWYTENYPELQKQITDQYNRIKGFLEGRGLEEGSATFNSMLEKNSAYQALIAQRSGLYFMEEIYNKR